ncbi:MAG: AAA family ATPase, partial [Muribaculaceae bacterium]|nr:AAA family ATPase [Muribaculaceae bacterium]
MLRRKIETLLDEWRQAKDRKPIVIKGCRQCGKTFSVLRFARQHYRNVVYLNFME